jgi:hypothetical protein
MLLVSTPLFTIRSGFFSPFFLLSLNDYFSKRSTNAIPVWNGWPMHYWYGLDYSFFTNPTLTSVSTLYSLLYYFFHGFFFFSFFFSLVDFSVPNIFYKRMLSKQQNYYNCYFTILVSKISNFFFHFLLLLVCYVIPSIMEYTQLSYQP